MMNGQGTAVSSDDVKAQARERFGQYAQNYVTSDIHATGADLERLLEVANPQSDWRGLDVATGGGHTALKFAPRVRHMVATDFGFTMLEAARANVLRQNVANMTFAAADAEALPFLDNSFDLVTCRVAIHHFPDAYRFMLEAARVLKPGGLLAVQDHMQPEDKRALDYLESFERLRDPSHHRAYSESEWRGLLLDADFIVEHVERMDRAALMIPWAERQGCTPDTIERLRIMLAQAPRAVTDWIHPRSVLSPDAGFNHVYIILTGRKPG
jgi:ubiquinone/menaquinone biosynthesis C-methylase UbiE